MRVGFEVDNSVFDLGPGDVEDHSGSISLYPIESLKDESQQKMSQLISHWLIIC
jgi:hypothetical protein